MKTYFDFADNDREYLLEDYKNGRVANYMGSMAQNICERYMKHIIDRYDEPQDVNGAQEKMSALRTHSLNKLIKYISGMGYSFRKETREEMQMIDGFYFSTRYPGDDSYVLDKDDIEHCARAVELCREDILSFEEAQ